MQNIIELEGVIVSGKVENSKNLGKDANNPIPAVS